MLLKSLKLNNIRSYTFQEINFPAGSTLLAGDIGSGKSSILLAIEFALFGLKKKDLSGGALLRTGERQGSVELTFEIDGKNIIIKRVLKREKDDVRQETGYIIINDTKKEGTHLELKSMVLELLGYPKGLLTRSKDMIYRYTVYTPQEEMKQIIFDDEENRLDILRRLFGIDKYKRIKENSAIFIRYLREKRKEMEGSIMDLDAKQRQKNEKQGELIKVNEQLNKTMPEFYNAKERVKQQKEMVALKEKELSVFNLLKKDIELNDLRLRNKIEQKEMNIKRVDALNAGIDSLRKQLQVIDDNAFDRLKEDIQANDEEINQLQKKAIEVNKRISELEFKKRQSAELISKVTRLEKCPVCMQEVDKEHKDSLREKETISIKEIESQIKIYLEDEKRVSHDITAAKKKNEMLRNKDKELGVIRILKHNLDEKSGQKEELLRLQEAINREIEVINLNKESLCKNLINYEGTAEQYSENKEKLDELLKEERKIEMEKIALEKDKEITNKLIISLDEEINSKLKVKEKLNVTADIQNWLSDYFVNLIDVMERHVMFRVHNEFNELFSEWFNTLIEDANLSIKINESFTPLVEQNGYEIDLAFLSGGEKASCALAYRLALNKVINDVIGTIKTKDIIILDEPTDGFSTEQLDKLRIVLEQLNMRQGIIVSHESKIESFVENVIRVTKEEHVSRISG